MAEISTTAKAQKSTVNTSNGYGLGIAVGIVAGAVLFWLTLLLIK